MKCALIGYGYWGKIIEKYIRSNDHFDLEIIYDLITHHSVNMEEIFTNPLIECVFICTPIDTHYSIVKTALTFGKHVFCEKPLCKGFAMAKELSVLSMKNKLCLYTDYIYMNSKSIQYLRNNLTEIGNIHYIKASIKQFGTFYKDDDVFEVIGVHMISALIYILSSLNTMCITPQYCKAIRVNKKGMALHGIISFNVNKDLLVNIECSLLSNRKERLIEISGENGNLIFDMLDNYTVAKTLIFENAANYHQTNENLHFDESNNLSYAISDFFDAISKNRKDNLLISVKVTKLLDNLKLLESKKQI